MTKPEDIVSMTPAEHICEAAKLQATYYARAERFYSNEAKMVLLGQIQAHLMFAQAKQGQDALLMQERIWLAQPGRTTRPARRTPATES
jgi:hypothetical protein